MENNTTNTQSVEQQTPVNQSVAMQDVVQGTQYVEQPKANAALNIPPLFADEGESMTEEHEPSGEQNTKTEEQVAEKHDAAPAQEADGEEEGVETSEAGTAGEKPPKGYVPYSALHEERMARKQAAEQLAVAANQNAELIQRLQEAENIISALQSEGKTIEPQEFRYLSQAEYDKLVEEDPAEALRYINRVREFERLDAQRQMIAARESMIIDDAYRMAQADAPEVFTDPEYASQLMDFAEQKGFPKSYMAALTNPNTRLVTPDGKHEIVLGPAAAGIVMLLNRYFKDSKNGSTPESVRKQLEEELTGKITKELIGKLKKQGGDFRDLETVPLAKEPDEHKSAEPVTEESYARMTPEQRRAFLGG